LGNHICLLPSYSHDILSTLPELQYFDDQPVKKEGLISMEYTNIGRDYLQRKANQGFSVFGNPSQTY
jgi:hypothetical protein